MLSLSIIISLLSRTRHWLFLILIALLPFHALFVTVGTKLILGDNRAPMALLAIWKEVLMCVLFVVGSMELFFKQRSFLGQIVRGNVRWTLSLHREVVVGIALILLALLLTPFNADLKTFVYGFRYVFVPIIFFLMLAQLDWDRSFMTDRVAKVIYIVAGIVAAYGMFSFFVPAVFFEWLGYDKFHSLYSPWSPISAFQQVSGTSIRRVQSTFSGPNQLGMWLLLPWSLGIVHVIGLLQKRWNIRHIATTLIWTALVGITLFLTFSRAVWIAAFVITIIVLSTMLRGQLRRILLSIIGTCVIVAIVCICVFAPQLVMRGISNKHHIERAWDGAFAIISNPIGHGLGTAGPASNRVSDPCIYFEPGADVEWARKRYELCIFVGEEQVQPSPDIYLCDCAVLPENWYLQIGYELGVLGLLLYLGLIGWTVYACSDRSRGGARDLCTRGSNIYTAVQLAFIGVCIGGLFLHSWEGAAVSYTVWGLMGVLVSLQRSQDRVSV